MGDTPSKHDPIQTIDTDPFKSYIHQKNHPHLRKLTVCEESAKDDLIEKVTVVPTILDEQTERWLFDLLQNHYLFCSLSDDEVMKVVNRMVKCVANADDYVFKIDDRPGAFFVIQKGNVDVEGKSGYKKANLSRDDCFGELGLLYNSTRTASIKTKVPCEFWCLTKNNFKVVEKEIIKENFKNSIKYINELQLFEYVTEEQKNSIACSMFTLKFPKNSIIYRKNDEATSLFIVKSGEIVLRDQGKQSFVKEQSYFGDECFEHGKKPLRTSTAEALTVVECLSISREGLKDIMGDSVKQLINYNIFKSALYKSLFFSKLDPINIQKLIHLSKFKVVKNDEILFESDRQPTKIIVILYGSGSHQKIGTLLGEDFMLSDRKPSVIIRKQGDGEVAEISYQKIIKILKETSLESLRRKKNNIVNEDSIDAGFEMEDLKEMRDQSNFQRLTLIKILEQEQYSYQKILLTENQETNSLFSIRMITKSKLNEVKDEEIIKCLFRQRTILEDIAHPFIVRMVNIVKTRAFLFMIFQYNWSYSLFTIIREIGLLNRSITRFYIASLILALEYLHSKEVVFRDLKPENICVYRDGYIKINNFSWAKKLSKDIGYRTFTQIGTPHYMAPQTISGKGYSFAADLWSLGIIFYEFVIGKVPFGEDEDDPFKIHQMILNKNVTYPNVYQDQGGKELIEQFLSKFPELRLSKGYNNLKAHSYFNSINWNKLSKKEEVAPYKSKKFYFGQVIPLSMGLNSFIEEREKNLSNFSKSVVDDWDETF